MDLHRLAEERSVAYHRVIAERLLRQPEVLERARQRVQGWLASGAPFYARKWAEILAGDPPSIAAFLVERSVGLLATALRALAEPGREVDAGVEHAGVGRRRLGACRAGG